MEIIFVVLAASVEDTGNGTPVVLWHPGVAAGVGLLILSPHHEPLVAITALNMGRWQMAAAENGRSCS